jgi:hypothetical protein
VIGEEECGRWTKIFLRFEIEERFLTARTDHFAGAKWEEKASVRSVRNDGGVVR